MLNEKTQVLLEERFRKNIRKNNNIRNAYMLIHSETQGIHLNMAEGATGSFPANPEQAYFIASIDKLFTSVLIGILEQHGELSYEDSIVSYLDSDLLHNLHVYKGEDYTKEIKIKHLLNHTSGLFDFVEDKPKYGTPMFDMLIDKPAITWSQKYIIQWSKKHLTTHFPPGEGFHYSNTGYYLLGLIIENICSVPYPEVLKTYLFEPLHMKHTYMLQHLEPIEKSEHPIADCYVNNINITQKNCIGLDYAGGRIVSTTEDLLKFMKALVTYKLLRKESMEKMKDWAKFSIGIDYGYGIMHFKPVPLLMPQKYNVWGIAGSPGSFMFYHPELDAYFIGSLNRFRYHRKGIMQMFKMIDIMLKNKRSKETVSLQSKS